MTKVFANSGGPDQTSRAVASDLSLLCLPITLWGGGWGRGGGGGLQTKMG